jgi:phage terminase large subunit-like protein
MKTLRHLVLLSVVMVLLALALVPAAAQRATATVTVTEATINSTYRVTNPARLQVSAVVVDLQPGQAVISATITLRNGTAAAAVATLTPSVTNGRVSWLVSAATWDGQPATGETLSAINQALASTWRSYIRSQAGTGRVTAVSITESELTYSFASRR